MSIPRRCGVLVASNGERSLFVSYEESTTEVSLKLSELPAILRVLLTTDGTVTRSLQAYFAESVDVEVLSQSEVKLRDDDTLLGAGAGQAVLRRRVRLIGGQTARVYAYANTFINPNHLPHALASDLATGQVGVGEIVQQRNLETRREIIDTAIHLGPLSVFDESILVGPSAYRHYCILHGGQVLMHIKEYFPLSSYRQDT